MLEYLSLIGIIIFFTGLFAIAVASADIETIKANWDKRRCEVPVMIAGGLFRPKNDSRTSNEFAKENFSFCVRKLADDVIKMAFAPLFQVASQQMNATETMAGPLNSVRAMIQKGVSTFSDILQTQYKQYTSLYIQFTKSWHHLGFAFGRVQGMVTNFIYLGLTLSTLIQNFVQFSIMVVLVFIGIMSAMIILIWFGLIPFLGVIITTLGIVIAADIETNGWATGGGGGLAGAFCIDPNATVILKDGTKKPLSEIKVGDSLPPVKGKLSENKVEGILNVDSSKEPLVSIYDILMSESHRVYINKKWILAKDHPDAKKVTSILERLICLNTTHHSVPLYTNEGVLYVSDWEEVSTLEGKREWIDWIHTCLNGTKSRPHRYPSTVPLTSHTSQIITPTGWKSVEELQIGDSIFSEDGFTKILGIYEGEFPVSEAPSTPEWISDGVWIRCLRFWLTKAKAIGSAKSKIILSGRFFITESGTFYLKIGHETYLVRDFTEVGVHEISKSYCWLDTAINKKR